MSTQVFPTLSGIAWPVARTPIFKTRRQESISGKRTFIADQSYPRWKWSLTCNFLRRNGVFNATSDEYAALVGFFNARQGMFDSFLYQDQYDNAVTNQQLGTGDGSNLSFPTIRAFGGYIEPILAVNTGIAATVQVNGVTQTFGTAWGWSFGTWGANGVLFTAGHAPGAGLPVTITYSYYWPCTFSADQMDFSSFMNALFEVKKIEFESVK